MVTTSLSADPRPVELRIELVPNCSLTRRSATVFLGSLVLLTLTLAGVFAAQGFWPVLAVAVLELCLLGWAVRASMRRGADREVIVVSEDSVQIEKRMRMGLSVMVFSRHWAKVTLRDPPHRHHPSRLVIESHGRACEVGRFLTEDERRGLASRLLRLVGKTNESPALGP
ncbi:MAG TPA: DUF2244 domain-containing protein [Steroidobacteraceae bacterium]|nr:DUF2244 domain-containing protein [Steroidobacteraceae bacterium]